MLGEVPAGWRVASYAAAAAINRESLPGTTSPERTIRYFDISSIPSPGVLGEPSDLSFGEAPSRARRVLRSGDTLVSCVRPYLRSFAFLREAEPNDVASTGFAVLSPVPGVDPAFLYQTVWRDDFLAFLKDRMTGSNYPAVNASDVAEASVLLPPLPEQKKIAAILSSVDEAIQATQAVIDQTRRVKEGLLQDLLTRGIGHTRFKQTEIGEIPEGWRVARMRDLGDVTAGKARNPDGGGTNRPYLRCANVFDDRIDVEEVFEMPFTDEEFRRYTLRQGDILLNEGQSLHLVGRPAVFQGVYPSYAFQNSLVRLRVDTQIAMPGFTYQVVRFLYQTGAFAAIATQTTSIAHLGVSRFANIKVALPPLDEQLRLLEPLTELDALRRNSELTVENMVRVKSGLLTDLLTGKVRVTP